MENMTSTKVMSFLVALFAIAVLSIASVSAFGTITSVEVAGVEAISGTSVATFAGETLPVRVLFNSVADANDVRVKAWISGSRDYSVSTERFDVLSNRTYSKLLSVQIPFDIDPSEDLKLNIAIESKNNGNIAPVVINLAAERESYIVEILDVAMDSQAKAGNNILLDVILKNRGRQLAEDTFVKASIPALGVESHAYFGDLSSQDQFDPDKEDAAERKLLLSIPANAPAGVYAVQIEAYNADSSSTATKRISVTASSEQSIVVPSVKSKTFAVGEQGIYSLTLVNSGNQIKVYDLVVDSASNKLNFNIDEPVVAIPAGSSKTVKISAVASEAGDYNFAVNVHSDGTLVKSEQFMASVEGSKGFSAGNNATVLLTVILAIIFVVLLVVLIVLLTRKPQKSEEFGESYY